MSDPTEAIWADLTRSPEDSRQNRSERHAASINHFLRTARAGQSRGASTGQRTAHRLAAALHEIGDDIALLDTSILEGFANLLRAASGPWPTDEARHQIFTAIAAAGKRPHAI